MSEYQYYEFLAVDCALTQQEVSELHDISTRAEITPTRFSNVYNYGDMKADPRKLLERYFDVHIYLANWGSRRVMLRFPHEALSIEEAERYCFSDFASARRVGEHIVIDLKSEWDGGDGWAEGEGWMDSLAGARDELLRGDLRLLYLAWLLGVEAGEFCDDDEEPPVPPVLGSLSESLTSLAEFLRIDEDLIAAAAEASTVEEDEPSGLANWIADLPASEKDVLLLQVAQGGHSKVSADLVRRFRSQNRQTAAAAGQIPRTPTRTVDELVTRADELREEYEREQERVKEEARRQREEAAAIARAKQLDALSVRTDAAWVDVERLVALKHAKRYDEAVRLLADLGDLAARESEAEVFNERLEQIRRRHARKPAFIARLDKAGLG